MWQIKEQNDGTSIFVWKLVKTNLSGMEIVEYLPWIEAFANGFDQFVIAKQTFH